MIDYNSEPPLASVTASNGFWHNFMSRSCCEGILTHSSLQDSFSSLRFPSIHLGAALLRSHYSTSARFRSGLGPCSILIHFFLSHSVCAWDLCPVA